MDKKINVVFEDSESFVFSFEKEKKYNYYLMGENNIFNYDILTILNDEIFSMKKDNYIQYNKFKVVAVQEYNDKEIIVYDSDSFSFYSCDLDIIDVKVVKSFQGISLSFQTDEVYDSYIIFEKNENFSKVILKTNDFMVNTNKLVLGKTYYIEGYKNVDDHLVLVAKSNCFECSFNKNILPLRKKVDLSVIVPVYNSQLFLPRCLDSILLSSYDNVDVILVDDGSFDSSLEICNWYKDTYPSKFRVVHTENFGVSHARNIGLEMADGEYTQFMDNDDFIHPYSYEKSFDAVKKYNKPDMVIFKTIIKESSGKVSTCIDFTKNNQDEYLYSYEDVFNNKGKNTNMYFCAVWDKIVKTSIAKKVKFPEFSYYEDSAYSPTLFSYCETFYYVPGAVYVWDKRNAGTVGSSTTSYKKVDSIKLHDYFIKASIYSLSNGNKKRMKYLLYDSLKEIIGSYKSIKKEDFPLLAKSYEIIMITIIKNFKVLENEHIINDKDMFDLLNKLINS